MGDDYVGMDKFERVCDELDQLVALVKDAATKWRSQTNAREGISFKLAMKELERAVGLQARKGMGG